MWFQNCNETTFETVNFEQKKEKKIILNKRFKTCLKGTKRA